MMYRSQPCLPFFSSVIKNVASPNIEIKKLVYIYLLRYAEAEPDLALLSINTIQKALADANPQVRALALRVMSGIRVPVISQIVSLAIKKGCGDMSPHVRKAAALAVPKCYRLDPATLPQLRDYVATLLGDRQYYVVGAAVTAFMDVCPDRIGLIHKHYRGLVRKLVDMDEWGQLATLRLMTYYARKCFPRRTRKVKTGGNKPFYEATKDESQGEKGEDEAEIQVLDPDLELLLNACKPLLQSRNSAVVVAIARCYLHLATPGHVDSTVGPLVALLRSDQDVQQLALYNIVAVCLVRPAAFVPYATRFLVRRTDAPPVWLLKLELLTLIFPHCNAHTRGLILSELEHFSRHGDAALVRASVRALGRCARADPATASRCLRLLLAHVTSPDGPLSAEALTVIRHLIQQDLGAHRSTIVRLARNLDSATDPHARASIIWLVGEFAEAKHTADDQEEGDDNIAPDVLRILAKGFADESEPAKLQIVLLAAKVYVQHLNQRGHSTEKSTPGETDGPQDSKDNRHPIAVLWQYILLLARYDTSYDLRDRARLYKALLAVPSSTQLATLLLLAPKPAPHVPSPSATRAGFTLGSASLVLAGGTESENHENGVRGYEALPDWVRSGDEPDASVRDEDGGRAAEQVGERRTPAAAERLDSALKEGKRGVAVGPNGVGTPPAKEKTLDDWLAEGEGDEDEDEDEDEEESSEEEDEEDDSSGEESDEEDASEDDDEREEHDRLVK